MVTHKKLRAGETSQNDVDGRADPAVCSEQQTLMVQPLPAYIWETNLWHLKAP